MSRLPAASLPVSQVIVRLRTINWRRQLPVQRQPRLLSSQSRSIDLTSLMLCNQIHPLIQNTLSESARVRGNRKERNHFLFADHTPSNRQPAMRGG